MISYASSRGDFSPILGTIVIIIIIYIVKNLIDEKRKNTTSDYCKKEGLVFYEECDYIPNCNEKFLVNSINQKYYREYKFIIKGSTSGINFCILNFFYSNGRRYGHFYYTLCVLDKPGKIFPKFYIRKRLFFIDWIKEKFGAQNIVFEDDKAFSNEFILQGPDEDRIRKFFTLEVRNAFIKSAKNYNYEYEASNRFFIAYKNEFLELDEKVDLANNFLKVFDAITSVDKEGIK